MRYISATGQRSASFVCAQSDQNNYTNDLWTHYLIYFIRLSGSFGPQGQIISTCLWLGYFCNELHLRKMQRIERSKVIWQCISASLHPPPIALCSHTQIEILPSTSARAFSHLFIVKPYRWKKGVQPFRGKRLAVNIDCHCWESKRERNERKQVHLPQVYNPEITVCSGACLTALWAACASLLISLAPAVQELIWRFSESITLLSKVPLPER